MTATESALRSLSLVHGSTSISLWQKTLGEILHEHSKTYGSKTAVVVPWQKVRCTYKDLQYRSEVIARALLASGIGNGDRIAIMAGNRIEYIEVFLAAARIGCPLVVLNNTYTGSELMSALKRISPVVLFIAQDVGSRSLSSQMAQLATEIEAGKLTHLSKTIVFAPCQLERFRGLFSSYEDFTRTGRSTHPNELQEAEKLVRHDDTINMQFTSGTTGTPKAAMLTHLNIINNGRLVGSRMSLTSSDVVCCPPPLFHCFGLVMGFLAAFTHGASIVFPADQFDASLTYDAIVAENCTALLGVPTMFIAMLDVLPMKRHKIKTIRTGLAAGSMVPAPLLERLATEMGVTGILIAYGMTETSPVTFMMSMDEPQECVQKDLGTVMPHTSAKVVDNQGRILPRGCRGELCTSGYALMKGYFANEAGTQEVMRQDETGVVWMHTGDECTINEEGRCEITGRIKDMIIRGGENIFPAEIEEHLLRHPSISEASVVGLSDEKYGEVVSCFLRVANGKHKVRDQDMRAWVGEKLGRHKIPAWVFWVGDGAGCVTADFPKTGSGKHQKYLLRILGEGILKRERSQDLRAGSPKL